MFFKKNRVLEHFTSDIYPDIMYARSVVPEWYKKTPRFADTNKVPERLPLFKTYKSCTPFSETFFTGYMIPLVVDIAVEQVEDNAVISWNDPSETYVTLRESNVNNNVPAPVGCRPEQYTWRLKHYLKVPKGYSFLITHPLNRTDLPFYTLSGVIDENFVLYPGNVPFYIKENFSGIIPAGTPIAQIIPIKNKKWKLFKNEEVKIEGDIVGTRITNTAFGYYKKNFWQKKHFE